MKVLVVCRAYPDLNGGVALNYIRVRNLYYRDNGLDVTVLNYNCDESYTIDGIRVISLSDYKYKVKYERFDVLICHAPNLKNHYLFLKKYGDLFPKFVFFFHGHEVLKISEIYSEPYSWQKTNILKIIAQDIYDDFKLFTWRKYYKSVKQKSRFVLVSNWMLTEFEKWTKISREEINYNIIYNSVGKNYETQTYSKESLKKYDFISIRANMDESKYCVDVINSYAWKNPQYKFLLVGRGDIFNHINKAPNIDWVNKYLDQEEIINLLNQSHVALMPTRTDAQGVMMCEMATFGIPVITSDIPVCHEVFDDFYNIEFIDNNANTAIDLTSIYKKLVNLKHIRNDKFTESETVSMEVALLRDFCEEIK